MLNEARTLQPYVTQLRRHFHAHPELSFREVETSRFVQAELRVLDIPFQTVLETGIIAEIKGDSPGPVFLLRADMDALPVQEETGSSFASENAGQMHACGHDAHMAMLLLAAKLLKARTAAIRGTVRLLFQPGEEFGQGAHRILEASDVLKNVCGAFSLHVWSGLESGRVFIPDGPAFASADIFKIAVSGKGGHGALPHEGVDAVVAGSAIVMQLQTLVSREINTQLPAVVTVGSFHSGTQYNVLAGKAELQGTTRCFDRALRQELPKLIERVAAHTAEGLRATAEVSYQFGTPAVINSPIAAQRARQIAVSLAGPDVLVDYRPLMVGEDMAYYLERTPGAMGLLGVAAPGETAYPHHHGKFNVDESALPFGAVLLAQNAIKGLQDN